MKANNISPEVKTGIYNIVSAVQKRAEAVEMMKHIDTNLNLPPLGDDFKKQVKKSIEEALSDVDLVNKHRAECAKKTYSRRYPPNPYAVSWPKDAPFYLPWHVRIIKYLKFMFK